MKKIYHSNRALYVMKVLSNIQQLKEAHNFCIVPRAIFMYTRMKELETNWLNNANVSVISLFALFIAICKIALRVHGKYNLA